VSGYLSVSWLLRFLRTRTTFAFVVYRVILGLFILSAVVGSSRL
jgi:undecaprenyl pyrophosphate phosphatase UppP